MRSLPIILSFLFILSTTLHARPDPAGSRIRLPTDRANSPNYVYNCLAWRLAVEVNNARNWKVVPADCVNYVANYMTIKENGLNEPQYDLDCEVATIEAVGYLSTVTPTPNKTDTWLFGLTNTLLSDLPFYNQSGFGGLPFDEAKYDAYLEEGDMPGVPYIIHLYWAAKDKGFKTVILSGISEKFRSVIERKLKEAGIDEWDKLILKDKPGMPEKDFKASKRAELRKEGYKVIGNVGDQWMDLLTGTNAGKRTFKMPNPLYYVS